MLGSGMETPAKPVGGMDDPPTFQEFDKWFADEDACLEYSGKLRWPNGFTCPNCGLHPENPSRIGRGLYLCVQCKKQTSITAGTLFHQTHKSLRTWFLAMWFITSQKYGTSALGLQRVLGIGSYNTAWNWLHKLRRAMVCPERNRLTGTVEVDETYIGGVATGARGRGAGRKSIGVIAVEVRGRGMGRIRMSVIPDVSANSLHEIHIQQRGKGIRGS
jgi:transposase-like protein